MALQGCNSLRAYFRHLGTSMEQEKFLKSSIVFLILSLIVYIIFIIFLYLFFNQ